MGYRNLFLKNLEQDRPNLYQELKSSGQLESYLDQKVESVKNQVCDLVEKGSQMHEAKNVVLRQELLPSESDQPILGETDSPEMEVENWAIPGTYSFAT